MRPLKPSPEVKRQLVLRDDADLAAARGHLAQVRSAVATLGGAGVADRDAARKESVRITEAVNELQHLVIRARNASRRRPHRHREELERLLQSIREPAADGQRRAALLIAGCGLREAEAAIAALGDSVSNLAPAGPEPSALSGELASARHLLAICVADQRRLVQSGCDAPPTSPEAQADLARNVDRNRCAVETLNSRLQSIEKRLQRAARSAASCQARSHLESATTSLAELDEAVRDVTDVLDAFAGGPSPRK